MAADWSPTGELDSGDFDSGLVIRAPIGLVWAQLTLSIVACGVALSVPFWMRLIAWFVALTGALCGVGYRYRYRQLSIRPEFRGLSASTGARVLFRAASVCSLFAVVFTSWRASLVFPE